MRGVDERCTFFWLVNCPMGQWWVSGSGGGQCKARATRKIQDNKKRWLSPSTPPTIGHMRQSCSMLDALIPASSIISSKKRTQRDHHPSCPLFLFSPCLAFCFSCLKMNISFARPHRLSSPFLFLIWAIFFSFVMYGEWCCGSLVFDYLEELRRSWSLNQKSFSCAVVTLLCWCCWAK